MPSLSICRIFITAIPKITAACSRKGYSVAAAQGSWVEVEPLRVDWIGRIDHSYGRDRMHGKHFRTSGSRFDAPNMIEMGFLHSFCSDQTCFYHYLGILTVNSE